MSVVIRGMEMPKDCLKCPFCLFADGYWKCLVDGSHADFGGTCRPSLCPLIELPPHGRLIDADALIPMMKYATTDSEIGVFPIKIGFNAIIEVINNAPTIDAEPVRHGKWELAEDGWYCSACELYPPFDCDPEEKGIPYCPYCGARMDEDERD